MTRAFLALELDEAAHQRLLALVARLQRRHDLQGLRWARPQGLHVTLRFLGWTDADTLSRVEEDVAPVAAACGAAEVALGPLGTFPERGAPRVLWVGLGLPERMHALQRACEASARRHGFEAEERPFRAHLTLGRWNDRARRPELPEVDLGSARIDRLVLYRSELKPGGAVYTPLRVFALGA